MSANTAVDTPNADPSPASFEAALTELEGLVTRMEGGQMALADSLQSFKRGALLLQFCQQALQDAEQQVSVLEDGILRTFEGAVGEA